MDDGHRHLFRRRRGGIAAGNPAGVETWWALFYFVEQVANYVRQARCGGIPLCQTIFGIPDETSGQCAMAMAMALSSS